MDLFSFLGIKVKNNFFEKSYCNFLVKTIEVANKKKATVYRNGKGINDETVRNTYRIKMPNEILKECTDKIKFDLQPELESFYKLKFTRIQPLEFLFYDKGHFFRPHIDVLPKKNKRKISVVIFLNQQGKIENEADYGGGDLCLYGLRKDSPRQGIPIPSSKGLMVAFKSETLHEVTPVEWGNRCSLVIWFE